MNNVINKEDFISAIEDFKLVNEYHAKLNNFFHKNNVDGYIFQPDCTATVLRLLHVIFGEADKDNWIEYFCFDLEYGKKWKPGLVGEKYNIDIKLETPEDLYNILCEYENQ